MRIKHPGWLGLACGLWWVLGAGCFDSEQFSGRFLEEVQPNEALEYGDQRFALRLDLFQYGDEVGGLVHFYPTRWVEGTPDSPFTNDPLFCVWTNARRLGDDGSVRLRFTDWDGRENVLTLRGGAAESTLEGQKCPVGCDEAASYSVDESRALVFNRDEDRGPVTRCQRELEDFDFKLSLGGGRLRGLVASELSGERRLTLGIAWVGDSPDDRDQRIDWFYRVEDMQGQLELAVTRRLPPGRLSFSNTVDYVDVPGKTRLIMGVPFIFRDSTSDPDEEPGDEVETDWTRSTEPLVASTLVAQVEVNEEGQEVETGLLVGEVLMFVDGDPNKLPEPILALLKPGSGFRQGYWTYLVEVDQDRNVVGIERKMNNLLTIYGRFAEDYAEPRTDTASFLAALPPQ